MRRARAFTLIEVLVVVVLLGILAAVVIPALSNGATIARESALASDTSLLRRFIVVYTSQHLEVAPGYPDGDITAAPTFDAFRDQATLASNAAGETAARGTAGFKYGPYLSRMPVNPFNKLDTVEMLAAGAGFPAAANDTHGWIYQPQTGEIRPDNTGTNSSGIAYYDY